MSLHEIFCTKDHARLLKTNQARPLQMDLPLIKKKTSKSAREYSDAGSIQCPLPCQQSLILLQHFH